MRLRGFFAVAFTFSCLSCAPFNSNSELEQRVYEQDLQLRRLQPQQADTLKEVQAMREEIARLRGQIANLNNTGNNQQAAGGMQQEQAVNQVNAGQGIAPGEAAAVAVNEPITGIRINPATAPDSSAYAVGRQAALPQDSYGIPAEEAPIPVEAPSEEKWGQADPVAEPTPEQPKKDIAQALFDAGMNDFNARKYSAAERSFRDFLKNYPSHAQRAEAQYYLAESMFQANKYPDAALAYDEVISKYPKSSSAPKAYLMQGIAFSKMKQPDAAKQRMNELIRKYPNSPEASRAKTFLKTNK